MDLQAGAIYKTKDYSKFIIDSDYNRVVNDKHVKKVKESIKTFGDYGHCYPIVVDDKFKIIDGQHRFQARTALGLVIYYIQDIELDSTKLGGINDAIAKWKSDDFVKVAKGSDIYREIQTLISGLPDYMTVSAAMASLGINKKHLITNDDKKLVDLQRKLPVVKPTLAFLCKNITNHIFSANMGKDKSGVLGTRDMIYLALRMAKFGVNLNSDLMEQFINTHLNGFTYNELVSYLFTHKLIK
jgi:hypothetical protein